MTPSFAIAGPKLRPDPPRHPQHTHGRAAVPPFACRFPGICIKASRACMWCERCSDEGYLVSHLQEDTLLTIHWETLEGLLSPLPCVFLGETGRPGHLDTVLVHGNLATEHDEVVSFGLVLRIAFEHRLAVALLFATWPLRPACAPIQPCLVGGARVLGDFGRAWPIGISPERFSHSGASPVMRWRASTCCILF